MANIVPFAFKGELASGTHNFSFGGNKTATNGTFTISYPDPSTPSNAIISITS